MEVRVLGPNDMVGYSGSLVVYFVIWCIFTVHATVDFQELAGKPSIA